MDLSTAGRALVLLGVVILALGLVLTFAGRVPLIGRLPGDIVVRGEGWTVYVPVATSIVLSVVLSLILGLLGWFGRR